MEKTNIEDQLSSLEVLSSASSMDNLKKLLKKFFVALDPHTPEETRRMSHQFILTFIICLIRQSNQVQPEKLSKWHKRLDLFDELFLERYAYPVSVKGVGFETEKRLLLMFENLRKDLMTDRVNFLSIVGKTLADMRKIEPMLKAISDDEEDDSGLHPCADVLRFHLCNATDKYSDFLELVRGNVQPGRSVAIVALMLIAQRDNTGFSN